MRLPRPHPRPSGVSTSHEPPSPSSSRQVTPTTWRSGTRRSLEECSPRSSSYAGASDLAFVGGHSTSRSGRDANRSNGWRTCRPPSTLTICTNLQTWRHSLRTRICCPSKSERYGFDTPTTQTLRGSSSSLSSYRSIRLEHGGTSYALTVGTVTSTSTSSASSTEMRRSNRSTSDPYTPHMMLNRPFTNRSRDCSLNTRG